MFDGSSRSISSLVVAVGDAASSSFSDAFDAVLAIDGQRTWSDERIAERLKELEAMPE